MARITIREHDCLVALARYRQAHGYAPSLRELCEAIGVSRASTNHVQQLLGRLEIEGLLTHAPGVARSLVLTERGEAAADDPDEAVVEVVRFRRFGGPENAQRDVLERGYQDRRGSNSEASDDASRPSACIYPDPPG